MKLQTLALLALSTSVVQGFAPVAFARGGVAMKSATPLFSEEPKEGEEGGFDLDLEEMFEM